MKGKVEQCSVCGSVPLRAVGRDKKDRKFWGISKSFVYCESCGNDPVGYDSMGEAIEAWNMKNKDV